MREAGLSEFGRSPGRGTGPKAPPHDRLWAETLALGTILLVGCDSGDAGPVDPPDPPPPVPTTVMLTPESAAFTALGDTLGLSAEVTDQYGAAMPNATVTWQSQATDIATVESTGARAALVVAVAKGETSVVATAGAATASAAVAVEQVPASVESVAGSALGDFAPWEAVEVVTRVQDRNGFPVFGVEVVFAVEEGAGTVDPESSTTDSDGLATTVWAMGTSGAQTLSATAGPVSGRFSATLCDPLVLEPGLELGVPRVVERSACGASVEAREAGAYFRFTLVGTSVDDEPNATVELSVTGHGPSSGAPRAFAAPRDMPPVAGPSTDPHPSRQERDRRVLSWIARPDGPDPLPDLRGAPQRSSAEPPAKREFTWGKPGTIEDNCTVALSPTGILLAHNDHIAIYADETLSPSITAGEGQLLADHYEDFGHPTIQAYFGGVGDVDGDGRILAFVEDLNALDIAAFVWMGDLLSKEDCPASNEAELMRIHVGRFNHTWGDRLYHTTGLVVHEAKHISSHHQLVRRAGDRGQSHFAVINPPWVEEGTAEIAREISARLGWESIGGPPPGATVRGSDLRRQREIWTREAHGVLAVLEGYGRVLISQPNSVTGHDPYGAGWGFFRFLGDWFGGAGEARLGDSTMFARLNGATVSEGLDGVREVTGRSFEELMVAYAQAVSLAGTGSPEVAGVPRFSTYDMTGVNRYPFSTLLNDGRFPYPVTITGSGRSAPLWLPLSESTTISGWIGPNGFRIHDFRAERAGDRATIRVDVPEHVRLVVVRIPDQMERGGTG